MKLLVALAVLLATSCGPTKEEGTTAQETENRERALATYSRFEGLYRGFLTPNSGDLRPQPIEMELRIVQVRDGVNPNDEPRFRPELRGYFHPTDYDLGIVPIARRPIAGRYYEDRGELVLSQTDNISSRIPDQGRVSLSLTLQGDELEGDATYTIVNAVYGRLSVKRYRK